MFNNGASVIVVAVGLVVDVLVFATVMALTLNMAITIAVIVFGISLFSLINGHDLKP
jgi:hypothetical protein